MKPKPFAELVLKSTLWRVSAMAYGEHTFRVTASRGKRGGYNVTCERCGWKTARPTEPEAWLAGKHHREVAERPPGLESGAMKKETGTAFTFSNVVPIRTPSDNMGDTSMPGVTGFTQFERNERTDRPISVAVHGRQGVHR